jgi:hypothetical protein
MINIMKTKPHASIVTRCLFSAFFLGMALCVPSPAAMTPDAKEKNWPANPEQHQITLRREAADAAQKMMIATAEMARPDVDAQRQAMGDAPEPKDASQWWYREDGA